MLLGFFMNAAITRRARSTSRENKLEGEVKKKIAARWSKVSAPKYHGGHPEG